MQNPVARRKTRVLGSDIPVFSSQVGRTPCIGLASRPPSKENPKDEAEPVEGLNEQTHEVGITDRTKKVGFA